MNIRKMKLFSSDWKDKTWSRATKWQPLAFYLLYSHSEEETLQIHLVAVES